MEKPHVVLVPYPAQGHAAPLMQLARLLHARGFHITFVHTEFNYHRLVRAKGEAAVKSAAADFHVEAIADGLSLSVPQHDVAALVDAVRNNCLEPFQALLRRLASEPGVPPVSCVVADVVMTFAARAAREAGLPEVQFFTASACGLMGYFHYEELIKRSLVPLKDTSCLTNGYLDTLLDWVPGVQGMRLKDMPTFCHTTDPNDTMLNITLEQMRSAVGSKAIILNTFYEIEKDVVDALTAFFPPIYTVGPLTSLTSASPANHLRAIDISLWRENTECLSWLDTKDENSVVYVNFGSVAVMSAAQTREFARGLAKCGFSFLWVMRPDVVDGEDTALPQGFLDEVGNRGLVVPWCPQAAVLKHTSVGLFVTHCGWNSLLEAAVAGLPVLGWPVFAEQPTNCRQACECWGNGAELPKEVKSDTVAALVDEMMRGKLGKERREKALEWKKVATEATREGGSSWQNIDRLVDDVLLKRT